VDPSDASVPNATVNLYLPAGKSPVLSMRTTSDGNFDFTSVRPDTYRLEVRAAGFNGYVQVSVAVDPARQTSLAPIHLEVQSASQSIDVVGTVTSVDTNSAEVSNTVTQSQVADLPVLDRQINNLFYTQPGVNANGRSDTAINGVRSQDANVTLDGVNIQDNFIRINGLDYLPNKLTIGEVSELTVSTSNLDPALGGNAFAVSLTTPSGTNSYHGGVYWYQRNNFFSANDWFNNEDGVARSFLNLNQFGATVGGPIKKDKLLFYAAWETYDLKEQQPTLDTILTPLARQGILQYRLNGTGAIQQFNVLQNPGATPAPLKIDPYMATILAQVPTVGNSTAVGDGLNYTGYQFNARANTRRDSIEGRGSREEEIIFSRRGTSFPPPSDGIATTTTARMWATSSPWSRRYPIKTTPSSLRGAGAGRLRRLSPTNCAAAATWRMRPSTCPGPSRPSSSPGP
jgi:hypothetical protein